MIITAIVCATLSTCMYVSLIARFNQRALYLMNGYSAWVDLFFTIFVIGLSASAGTTTALLISAFTGVFLSVALILLRKYLGYSKIERVKGSFFKFKFVNYPPSARLPSFLSKVASYLPTTDRVYA